MLHGYIISKCRRVLINLFIFLIQQKGTKNVKGKRTKMSRKTDGKGRGSNETEDKCAADKCFKVVCV